MATPDIRDLADNREPGYLDGQMLIAMPTMGDPRFTKSVIYLCAHSAEGAVGLVINKPIDTLTFPELLEQLEIETRDRDDMPVHFGGPVEARRGFVLHSAEFVEDGTLVVDEKIALTATIDILREIAKGTGPRQTLLALGYAGWGPGQLESEIHDNAWLNAPADTAIIFDGTLDTKWERALATLGIDQAMLSGTAGRA
ncbi:MAG: YqgE/AlgH family protein [Alphaproteobacteria bacterium]|nr:YqgE/AlgH family protein [Alphaproteobacteria bacterium]